MFSDKSKAENNELNTKSEPYGTEFISARLKWLTKGYYMIWHESNTD
jgi:hypothetical protein